MKKTISYFLYTLLLAAIVCACNDSLDITQSYAFDLQVMPYPKRIVQGETVEIRCQLVKEGDYQDTQYVIRYFQPDGKGELRLDDGRVLTPNDRFPLTNDVFRLYYTSLCTDQQNLDVYIQDNFGQVVQKTFGFQNESVKEAPAISLKYTFTSLPVPSVMLQNDTVEIRCQIVKEDNRNTSAYFIRYFQPNGKGVLIYNDTSLKPNDLYPLDTDNFSLYYVSNCTDRQTIDVYITDSNGQVVQKTFSFENQPVEIDTEIDFGFELDVLPVPKSIVDGETVEIRCQIKRADSRNDTDFHIRYFQPDGKGALRLDDGRVLIPNDLFQLSNDTFRLYYTSQCKGQQTIDIYVEDRYGKVVGRTFSFTS